MMHELVFDVPRSLWWTANSRIHWAVRANKTKVLREMAAIEGWHLAPFKTRARATAYIAYPRNGRADPANAAVVKPLIDGLVDSGVLEDDDHEHLLGPDYRRDASTGVQGLWRVRIVLEEAT